MRFLVFVQTHLDSTPGRGKGYSWNKLFSNKRHNLWMPLDTFGILWSVEGLSTAWSSCFHFSTRLKGQGSKCSKAAMSATEVKLFGKWRLGREVSYGHGVLIGLVRFGGRCCWVFTWEEGMMDDWLRVIENKWNRCLVHRFERWVNSESESFEDLWGCDAVRLEFGGLHCHQQDSTVVPSPHSGSIPDATLPKGIVPYRRAPGVLHDDAWPQQRQEAYGSAHRQACLWNHSPPHRQEPNPGLCGCCEEWRSSWRLNSSWLSRCCASSGSRCVPTSSCESGHLPDLHRSTKQCLPQHQVHRRVPGRWDHELCQGVLQQLCHQAACLQVNMLLSTLSRYLITELSVLLCQQKSSSQHIKPNSSVCTILRVTLQVWSHHIHYFVHQCIPYNFPLHPETLWNNPYSIHFPIFWHSSCFPMQPAKEEGWDRACGQGQPLSWQTVGERRALERPKSPMLLGVGGGWKDGWSWWMVADIIWTF